MRLYFHKTPGWLKKVYPEFIWKINTKKNELFLTFDDGPVPNATPYILEVLHKYDAEATFFVVGDNVRKNPGVIREVIEAGHQVGNHTYNHLGGWNTPLDDYLDQIKKCDKIIYDQTGLYSGLFRPPYGRITLKQARRVSAVYDVIMWDILSGDFDSSLNHRNAMFHIKKFSRGSILVFHDNEKYLNNVRKLLPEFLSFSKDQGYIFKKIEKRSK